MVFKSRRLRWARRVAHIGEVKKSYKTLIGKFGNGRPL
jgi:hypothetical protein